MVTKTEVVKVPVEVIKPLPESLTAPLPYPPELPEDYTVDDIIELTFALFDALDLANSDRAKADQLTQPEPVPQ